MKQPTGKVAAVQERMQQLFSSLEDEAVCREAQIHTGEVARFSSIFALKRGENAELAETAGWLHDCWRCASGLSDGHAAGGAKMAREWLSALPVFSPEETEAVCTAIGNHSRKTQKDDPLSEVVKDADVLSHYIADPAMVRASAEAVRLPGILKELGWVPAAHTAGAGAADTALCHKADEILRIMMAIPQVRDCRIYGSLASGTSDAFSDIDIEIDASGCDNGRFMLTLPDLLQSRMKVAYCDFAPSLMPDKYVVSLALDEQNPFLIADLCCNAVPHCTSVTREEAAGKNRAETHLLKLWTANLKHFARGLDCRADILHMAGKCGVPAPQTKTDAQLLGEVLCWLEVRLADEMAALIHSCRRCYCALTQ